MAYTNRAIASMVVTGMSVHAWHAIASEDLAALRGGETAFAEIIGIETSLCTPPPAKPNEHCLDAIKALEVRKNIGDAADQIESTLEALEGPFNKTVGKIEDAIIDLNKLQREVLDTVAQEIGPGQGERGIERSTLYALRTMNAPQADYVVEGHEVNVREFACAVEGWTTAPVQCETVTGITRPEMDLPSRSAVIGGVSNAARGHFQQFCANGACDSVASTRFQDDSAYLQSLLGNEGHFCFGYDGRAYITDSPANGPNSSNPAYTIGSKTNGALEITWRHGKGAISLASTAFSSDLGGEHSPGHSQSHDEFKGFWRNGGDCGNRPCFINFRGASETEPVTQQMHGGGSESKTLTATQQDLGQPSAFGMVRQDLGLMRSGKRGKWEVNPGGRVKVPLGARGAKAELNLRPTRDGAPPQSLAVSKAKVYFHELGNEKVVPNMFDPFWRARLAPFTFEELNDVLLIAHDPQGQQVLNAMGPVEGISQ
jgi:hypothetical protein